VTTFKPEHDPHYQRESEQYDSPVPSREYIMAALREAGCAMRLKDVLAVFQITEADQVEGVSRRLKAMQRDGQLLCNRKGRFVLVEALDLLQGVVQGHRDGFGFCILDDGGEDIFLPEREMRAYLSGDRVLVRVTTPEQGGRREGVIVELLDRPIQTIVGRFYQDGDLSLVTPDDRRLAQDFIVPEGKHQGAQPGDYVLATLMTPPSRRHQATVAIERVLGEAMTPGMERDLAIHSHHLPHVFSPEALAQADAYGSPDTAAALAAGRVDLRAHAFVTMDGEDARDFDDAVYCEPVATGGYRLWVAIADVSHYVGVGSPLDEEARSRGNSVYFPSAVIPMLPEALSNELCSLKPQVDRFAMVCEMALSAGGKVESVQLYEAVIHSHARLTYQTVSDWLTGTCKPDAELFPHIQSLYGVYQLLLAQKKVRGAVLFDSQETRILFDDQGKIEAVVPVVRNQAHQMIEEMMLVANESVADFLTDKKSPLLYRVHDVPDADRLKSLRAFLAVFGLQLLGKEEPKGLDYARLLAQVAKREDAHLLQMVILRSMQQAVYSPEEKGHFGLAYDRYTHFTSPIRRYPDLVIHRCIKAALGIAPAAEPALEAAGLLALGQHCSQTERRADLAARDAMDWLKCHYMLDKVGGVFSGHISDVTAFGLFIQLDEIDVQGLLHISSLSNDYYDHDRTHHLLRGRRSGVVYPLGGRLTIMVARVDLDQRRIDFELVDQVSKDKKKSVQSQSKGKPKGRKRSGRKRSTSRKKTTR